MNVLFALSFILLRHTTSLSCRVLHATEAPSTQVTEDSIQVSLETEIENILHPMIQGNPKQNHLDKLLKLLPKIKERNPSQPKENSKHVIEITRINQKKKEEPITFILVPKKQKGGAKPLFINNLRGVGLGSELGQEAVEDDLKESDLIQEDGAINDKGANQLTDELTEETVDSSSSELLLSYESSGPLSSTGISSSSGSSSSGSSSSGSSSSGSSSSGSSSSGSSSSGSSSSESSSLSSESESIEIKSEHVLDDIEANKLVHESKHPNLSEDRHSVSLDTVDRTRAPSETGHDVVNHSNHEEEIENINDDFNEPVAEDDQAIASDALAEENSEKQHGEEDLKVQAAKELLILEEPLLRDDNDGLYRNEKIIYIANDEKSLANRKRERYEKFYNLSFVFNK